MNTPTTSTAPSPKATTKKKIPKSNKGKDSGTSSEEERWLDAIESGKLEEVFCFVYILYRSYSVKFIICILCHFYSYMLDNDC